VGFALCPDGAPRGMRACSRRVLEHGKAGICAHQAARERGDDWARGPWEDDADGGDHEGIGAEGGGELPGLRSD